MSDFDDIETSNNNSHQPPENVSASIAKFSQRSMTEFNDTEESKIDALMRMFEEERTRHREAELAAESRIRLLESKLKDHEGGSRARSGSNPSRNQSAGKTRDTVLSTTDRTSDSLFVARRSTTPSGTASRSNRSAGLGINRPVTPKKGTSTTPSTKHNKGGGSGVTGLNSASSAASARSARLAEARNKRAAADNNRPGHTEWLSRTSSRPNGTSPVRTPTPKAPCAKGVNTEQSRAWDRFCALAKDKFTPDELVVISNETLQQLMDHFSVTNAVERAKIEAHWAKLNNGEGAQDSVARERSKGATATTTPRRDQEHRKTGLKFPVHEHDFDLRTVVPPEKTPLTPRKLLKVEETRTANIENYHFSGERKAPRKLTLLRARSPATGNIGASMASLNPDTAAATGTSPTSGSNKRSSSVHSKKILPVAGSDRHGEETRAPVKRFYSKVPGTDGADKSEGKKRNFENKIVHSDEAKLGSKKMVKPALAAASSGGDGVGATTGGGAAGDEKNNRRGLKIHVQDPTKSRDSQRYVKQELSRSSSRPIAADSTLSTKSLEAAMTGKTKSSNAIANNKVAAPRKLQQPTSFQLKCPFAVD